MLWNFYQSQQKSCSGNGTNPHGGLLAGKKGVLYGTTSGETEDCGNYGQVYEMVPSSSGYAYRLLYSFGAAYGGSYYDGVHPHGELIADRSGALYGTTWQGGYSGYGTVFKLSQTRRGWRKTTIHDFQGFQDGRYPLSGLVMDGSGALYGTTSQQGESNGSGSGTLFKLTRQGGVWVETILHVFLDYPYDGGNPVGRLLYVAKAGGTLYGTTASGGSFICSYLPCGTVFELNLSSNSYRVIYNFSGLDGAFPQAGLIADKKGHLYGTTSQGGSYHCGSSGQLTCGTAFKLSRSGSSYTEVFSYSFQGSDLHGPDGAFPQAPLLADKAGNLYGTTQSGGIVCNAGGYGCGTVFKLTPSGGGYTESVVYSFGSHQSYSDGWFPVAPLIAVKAKFYGTTLSGGVYGWPCCAGGTVFTVEP